MGALTRDAILNCDDLPRESVDVEEWGGSVFVRSMSGFERDAFDQTLTSGETGDGDKIKVDMKNMRARLCALCMVDAKGNRLFSDDDVVALGKKSAKALDRVFTVAQSLNGMVADEVETAAEK